MSDTKEPWLSVVVPAFNEEKLIAQSLLSIRESITANGLTSQQWELIVCDNDSTDDTARIAHDAGARVIAEGHRQIARARNVGAANAVGEWVLFVDADTWPDTALMSATLSAMNDSRICAGGALVDSTEAGFGVTVAIGAWNTMSKLFSLAAGGYIFCRRKAFNDLGGFNEDLYASEEIDFSRRLYQWGRAVDQRFVILPRVRFKTSLRKLELYRPTEIMLMFCQAIIHPTRMLRDKKLLGMWYDGRR